MKILLISSLILASSSAFACQGLSFDTLEKYMLKKVIGDLQSMSWGEGNDSEMYVVKKALIGPLDQIENNTLAYSVKLQMIGETNKKLKKEVFGIVRYNVDKSCSHMSTVLSSGEKNLKF
jgi:hypothetical protein